MTLFIFPKPTHLTSSTGLLTPSCNLTHPPPNLTKPSQAVHEPSRPSVIAYTILGFPRASRTSSACSPTIPQTLTCPTNAPDLHNRLVTFGAPILPTHVTC